MEQTNGNLALMPRFQTADLDWDQAEKLTLLRQTYAKDLSQAEFELFIEHCRQIGLNPLTRQVQPIKFDGKTLSFHTTLHGLVAIACRAGGYAGIDPVRFDVYPKGDVLGSQHPNTASVTVYRIVQGVRCAYSAEVFWVERNRGMASWKSQPWTMLGKCTTAAALRLAFEETKGLYIEEELPAATGPVVDAAAAATTKEPEPPFLPPGGKSWPDWCKELAQELGDFDTREDYLRFLEQVTGKPVKGSKFSDTDWAKAAHKLQEMLWDVQQAKAENEATASVTVEAQEGTSDAQPS